MLGEAIKEGASDIHIEPDEGMIRIRQRIDGVLQEDIHLLNIRYLKMSIVQFYKTCCSQRSFTL